MIIYTNTKDLTISEILEVASRVCKPEAKLYNSCLYLKDTIKDLEELRKMAEAL